MAEEKKKKPAQSAEKKEPSFGDKLIAMQSGNTKGMLEDSMDKMAEEDYGALSDINMADTAGQTIQDIMKSVSPDNLDTPKMDMDTAIQNAFDTTMQRYAGLFQSPMAKRAGVMGTLGDILATAGAAFGMPGLMVGGSRMSNSANSTMNRITAIPAKFMNTIVGQTLSGKYGLERTQLAGDIAGKNQAAGSVAAMDRLGVSEKGSMARALKQEEGAMSRAELARKTQLEIAEIESGKKSADAASDKEWKLTQLRSTIMQRGAEETAAVGKPMTEMRADIYVQEWIDAGGSVEAGAAIKAGLMGGQVPEKAPDVLNKEELFRNAEEASIGEVPGLLDAWLNQAGDDSTKINEVAAKGDPELQELYRTDKAGFKKAVKQKLQDVFSGQEDRRYNERVLDAAIEHAYGAGDIPVFSEKHKGAYSFSMMQRTIYDLIGVPSKDAGEIPRWKPGQLDRAKKLVPLLSSSSVTEQRGFPLYNTIRKGDDVTEQDSYAKISEKIGRNLRRSMRGKSVDGVYYVVADLVSTAKSVVSHPVFGRETVKEQVHTRTNPTQIFKQEYLKNPGPIQIDGLLAAALKDFDEKGPNADADSYEYFTHQFINTWRMMPEVLRGVFE